MTSDPKHHEAGFDRIDADAVCESCGAVNPEDTLFCKSCGNNLRDQRVNRIGSGLGPEHAEVPAVLAKPVQWLSKALVLLGMLVVIWAVINLVNGNIDRWLSSTQHTLTSGPGAENLWKGPDSATYEGLLKQITSHSFTEDELTAAESAPASAKVQGGLYYLKSSLDANSAIIGHAAVKVEGETAFFVARLVSGSEVRGEFDLTSPNPKTINAGAKVGRSLLSVYGRAQRAKGGAYMCYGQLETEEDAGTDLPTVNAVAYRIPSE